MVLVHEQVQHVVVAPQKAVKVYVWQMTTIEQVRAFRQHAFLRPCDYCLSFRDQNQCFQVPSYVEKAHSFETLYLLVAG